MRAAGRCSSDRSSKMTAATWRVTAYPSWLHAKLEPAAGRMEEAPEEAQEVLSLDRIQEREKRRIKRNSVADQSDSFFADPGKPTNRHKNFGQ